MSVLSHWNMIILTHCYCWGLYLNVTKRSLISYQLYYFYYNKFSSGSVNNLFFIEKSVQLLYIALFEYIYNNILRIICLERLFLLYKCEAWILQFRIELQSFCLAILAYRFKTDGSHDNRSRPYRSPFFFTK